MFDAHTCAPLSQKAGRSGDQECGGEAREGEEGRSLGRKWL